MVFLKMCMIVRESKWIPCGDYLFVAVARFSENHYLNAHVCICACVSECVCVCCIPSLWRLCVAQKHLHFQGFISTLLQKKKKSRYDLTKVNFVYEVLHTQDIFLLSGFTNPNNRSRSKWSHKGGRQLGKPSHLPVYAWACSNGCNAEGQLAKKEGKESIPC